MFFKLPISYAEQCSKIFPIMLHCDQLYSIMLHKILLPEYQD